MKTICSTEVRNLSTSLTNHLIKQEGLFGHKCITDQQSDKTGGVVGHKCITDQQSDKTVGVVGLFYLSVCLTNSLITQTGLLS